MSMPKYNCAQCYKTFWSINALETHLKEHLKVVQSALDEFYPNACPYCEKLMDKPTEVEIMDFLRREK